MTQITQVDKQQEAIDLVKQGKNVFITGSAGVGKTYVAHKITCPLTVVVSPTGVAALNAGGMTCHKAFNLPVGMVSDIDKNKISQKMRNLFGKKSPIKRILIDEVGMLRRDLFELIDYKLRRLRDSSEPFGGLQVVGIGDFYQLEPIVSYNEHDIFYEQYSSPYCFSSPLWDFHTVILDKVYRQDDERQVRILNSIRTRDKWSKLAIQRINEECAPYENVEDTLHLCCYRRDADAINKKWYSNLQGKEVKYKANITGKNPWKESPVEHEVSLKVGAKVLISANDAKGAYVNGDRGTVTFLGNNFVSVKLLNGSMVKVLTTNWEKFEYKVKGNKDIEKTVESTFTQIPIRLSYAMTIHKVQGLTLEKAALHTGKGMFGKGQLYVALSRVRDLRKLHLVNPIRLSDLKVSNEVKEFYNNSIKTI